MALGLSIKFVGLKAFQKSMKRAGRRLPSILEQQLRKAGEVVIGEARKQFKGERTRALYIVKKGKRKKRRNPRPVTSPPDKLGIFEGTYTKQISQQLSGSGRSLRTEIGPVGVPYARRHELGIRMPKRPVLAPAIKEAEPKVVAILGRSFRIAFRG